MNTFFSIVVSILGPLVSFGIGYGFAPGALLRPFLWIYPKGSERPEEILGELYSLPFRKRIPWAFMQIEVAIFEGTRERLRLRGLRGPGSRRRRVADLAKAFERRPQTISVRRVDRRKGIIQVVEMGPDNKLRLTRYEVPEAADQPILGRYVGYVDK